MPRLLLFIAAISLLAAGSAIGGGGVAGAAAQKAGSRSATAGKVRAALRGRRGPRGRRGKTGATGPGGPSGPQGALGPQGPPGPGGAGTKSLKFTVNVGTPRTIVYATPGMNVEMDCIGGVLTSNARSTADNGVVHTIFIDSLDNPEWNGDADFDVNDAVPLNSPAVRGGDASGQLVFGSFAGNVAAVSFLVDFDTAQGDCVFEGRSSEGQAS